MKDQVTERALKIAKDRRGWNQVEFAKALDVEKANITNWLARGMPASQHIKVAKLLRITVEELLGGDDVEAMGDLIAAARISEPTMAAYDVKLTKEAVLFAAEWAKLPRALQAQVSSLVHAIVGEMAQGTRKKPEKLTRQERSAA